MNQSTALFSLTWSQWSIHLQLSAVTIGILLVLLVLGYFSLRKPLYSNFDVVDVEITLGNMGKMRIKPGYEEMRIAHKAWVELSTRKAGLLFDEENDVIVEVYNSWYDLFQEMRSLVKEIPIERIRTNKDTGKLVKVLIGALNQGLRPHLTMWQAKFRKWYDWQLEKERQDKNSNRTPQEIQRDYPQYDQLKNELKAINRELIQYVNQLEKIAHGYKIT